MSLTPIAHKLIVQLNSLHKCLSSTVIGTRSKMDGPKLVQSIKSCIPPLDGAKHKGQAGRIGVIGGSLEYTGAPYFAGISALRVGADLAHIFCTTSAAPVIKSYSPELIVHPLLDSAGAATQIIPWLDRLHVLVIGPGLGRDDNTFKVVSEVIQECRLQNIPLVIDADGLYLITKNIDLIKNYPYPGVILTPNKIEFERLITKINDDGLDIDFDKLGDYVTILRKGSTDEFFSKDPQAAWVSDVGGSARRCGGQGDLLSGSIATFLHWTLDHVDNLSLENESSTDGVLLASSLACYAAARLVRLCNEKAFRVNGRSMLASDMIEHIHESFEELYGTNNNHNTE